METELVRFSAFIHRYGAGHDAETERATVDGEPSQGSAACPERGPGPATVAWVEHRVVVFSRIPVPRRSIYPVMNATAPTPVASTENRPGRALTIALWVVQIGLALMFLMAGGNKLAGNPMMIGLFDAIGVGQWFRYVTGALEVTGAVLLLVPRVAGLGAALLVPVMLGAITTHLFILHNSPAMPLGLLVGLAFVVWGRRAQILAAVRRVVR